MSFKINKPSYKQSDKIQYHVTRPVEPTVDTDGKGTYNISPIGFPVRDVSASLSPTNPTLIQPSFNVGYNAFSVDVVYTCYTNISLISGLQTIVSDIKTMGQSAGTATVVMYDTHGYTDGQDILISGSVINGSLINVYNGIYSITVVNPTTFSFVIDSGAPSSAYGNLTASITLTDGMYVELAGQDDSVKNGYYKVRSDMWQKMSLSSQNTTQLKGTYYNNLTISAGGLIVVSHNISSITTVALHDKYLATSITTVDHGFSNGMLITVSGAVITGYNKISAQIEIINATSFRYKVSSLLAPETASATVKYQTVAGDIINLVGQTISSEDGLYAVYATPNSWIKVGSFYEYDGTENDNKAGDYGNLSDKDGNPLTHYRNGYSLTETAEFMRSNIELPLQFAQFKGSSHKVEDNGAFIQWMLSGRKLNIGGVKGGERVIIDGLGLIDSVNIQVHGELDVTDDIAISEKQTKISQESKLAVWGLTSHHSRSLEGFYNKSPYVKDYPFIYNSEYNENEIESILSGGHKDPTVDAEHIRIYVNGTANNDIRPICMDTLWYHRDNAYHNNITLDMSNPSVYGRHTMSIVHNLDTQDMVIMGTEEFLPAAVNIGTSAITVEDGTEWKSGDYVRFVLSIGTTLPSGLESDTTYKIGTISVNDLTFTNLVGTPITILDGGSGIFKIQRLAYPIYNNSEVVTALNVLTGITLANTQKVMISTVNVPVTKYYYKPRKKNSITLNNSLPWSDTNLTYSIVGSAVRVVITSSSDHVDFTNPNKSTSDIIASLQENNDLIPLPFDADIDVKYLMELFCDNSLINTTLSINKRAKIRAKKTFIHLPTPIDLEDGTTVKLDVSLPIVPDTDSFGYNTIGSLSGYANYVTQPRAYVLSGYQKVICTSKNISSITNPTGTATLVLADDHRLESIVFTPTEVDTTLNTIKLTSDTVNYSIGSIVTFYTEGTGILPTSTPQIVAGDPYVISSIIDDKIKLQNISNVDINFTTTGTGSSYVLLRNQVRIKIINCSASEYNKEFVARILNKNSFTINTPLTYTASVSNSGIISQMVVVNGAEGIEGLTERSNSAIFGAMPEVEYGAGDHIYHQSFTPVNITGVTTLDGSDKRVLLATVYPTSTSTFQWRMDNDPHLRMLQWSMLNVNAGGGDTGNIYPTGSFANVAYAHNLDIIETFSDVFKSQDAVMFNVYDNPLSYVSSVSPDFTQQQINALVRVRFPATLETELSNTDKETVASFNYQARTAYLDLIHDFITSRVMVNDNKNHDDPTVKAFLEYSTQLPENHTTMAIPSAFFGGTFMTFDHILPAEQQGLDATIPWITKGIYTPSYIYNAHDLTYQTTWNPYGHNYKNSSLPPHLSSTYTTSTSQYENNASYRYTYDSLESATDPAFAFGYGTQNKFIAYAESHGIDSSHVDDLKRRLWIDTYVIPDASFRQIQNMFNMSTMNTVEDTVKFYGSNWIPFAKIFSTDNVSPVNDNIKDVTDYTTVIATPSNLLDTLKTAIGSNPIATRFMNNGYTDSFVSLNTRETTSDDREEFLRNYVVGYSNNMPIDFYNGFRPAIYGNSAMTEYNTDTDNSVVNTETDAERIYRYSLNNYCNEYLASSATDVATYINDNFLIKNNPTTADPMLVRDVNASWMTFENGNPINDAPNSTIKHAITISGMNYLAEREFYMSKMQYNYTRVHMSFIFSKSAGRWIPLDYKQIPTSYLTPTFGSVALKQMERSIKIPNTNNFVPIYNEAGANTLTNHTYPIVNGTTVIDFLWKNPMCSNENPYKVLSNFGYWEMEPMQLNENCYPFLGNALPYDDNGKLFSVMDHNLDYKTNQGKNSDDYRFSRLLEPNLASPDGINFIVPNNVHGGSIGADNSLFLYQPHMWSVYWDMRTAVSAMDGCDIPSPTERTGGVMADPVLNSMFQYPNARNPEFYIPWHEDMSTDWLNSGWLVIDARIRDQVNNPTRDNYFVFDARITDQITNENRDAYMEINRDPYINI